MYLISIYFDNSLQGTTLNAAVQSMLVGFGEQASSNEDKEHHQDENDIVDDDKRNIRAAGNSFS